MEDVKRKFIVMYEPYFDRDEQLTRLVHFVENELEQIAELLSCPHFRGLSAPYVLLSDIKPRGKEYGESSERDIINELKKYLVESNTKTGKYSDSINNVVENILNILEEKPNDLWEEVSNELRGELALVIMEYGTDEDKDNLEYIIQCISKRKITAPRLFGEYLPKRHQIIVYYNTIKEYAESKELDFYDMMSLVLAHEFFHAMHCALDPYHPLWTGSRIKILDKNKKIEIKEALADAFSVIWCFNTQKDRSGLLNVAEDRFDSWKRNYYSPWPYAKAILLFCNRGDCFPQGLNKRNVEDAMNRLCYLLDHLQCDLDIVLDFFKW